MEWNEKLFRKEMKIDGELVPFFSFCLCNQFGGCMYWSI